MFAAKTPQRIYRVAPLSAPVVDVSPVRSLWIWPESGIVTGLWIGAASGLEADVYALDLDVERRGVDHMGTDGILVQPIAVGTFSCNQNQWLPMHELVRAGDRWMLELTNALATPTTAIVLWGLQVTEVK